MRYLLVLLALTAAYFGLALASLFAAVHAGVGSPIWAPSGLALGALLLWGVRYWPMVLLGNIAAVSMTESGPIAGAIIGTGNSLEAILGALLLRRVLEFDTGLSRVRDGMLLIGVGGFIMPVVSVAFWLLSLAVTGNFQSEHAWEASVVWWAGNLSGSALGAPFVLAWCRGPRPRVTPLGMIEAIALSACVLVVCELCFGMLIQRAVFGFPFAFLMFPPMVWAAMRFGVRGASAATAACTVFAVRATLSEIGPFVRFAGDQRESLTALAVFVFLVAATGLILSCAIRERQSAAEARIEAESKYHQLIEQASDGIFVTGSAGHYVEANRRGLEMIGYSLAELRGKTMSDLVIIDEGDSRTVRMNELNTGVNLLSERRLRRKDGATIPVEVSAKKLGDGRLLAIVRDISQRKRDEAQRTMMMRELDHRVKNNLAIVLSIADQTARSVDTLSEFGERFIGRIMSLARVHGLLARGKWTGADLDSIVTRTLQPHIEKGHNRVHTRGERCVVPSRAAGPLCMTLHELATNASKYGSLSVPGGIVEVTWEVSGQGTPETRLRLVWQESGGPAVTEPKARGFGTQLIEGGLAHEIGATVTLAFRPSGVCCEMAFSLVDEPSEGLREPDSFRAV